MYIYPMSYREPDCEAVGSVNREQRQIHAHACLLRGDVRKKKLALDCCLQGKTALYTAALDSTEEFKQLSRLLPALKGAKILSSSGHVFAIQYERTLLLILKA